MLFRRVGYRLGQGFCRAARRGASEKAGGAFGFPCTLKGRTAGLRDVVHRNFDGRATNEMAGGAAVNPPLATEGTHRSGVGW